MNEEYVVNKYREKKGDRVLKIIQEKYPESPRNWNNVGIMLCVHSRYSLGDKYDFSSGEELEEYLAEQEPIVSLPLYLLDHSGLRMSTGSFRDPWDSGQIGYIYATKEKVLYEWGSSEVTEEIKKKALRQLEGEVEVYNDYISGNVFGYELVKPCKCEACGNDHEEYLDSVWGFYGDDAEEQIFVHANLKREDFEEIDA